LPPQATTAARESLGGEGSALPGLVFVNGALNRIGLHQADRPQRQRDAMLQQAALEEVHLQAAASEVEDDPRLNPFAQRPTHRQANEPRFLLAADYLHSDSGFPLDALQQAAVVAGLACRGRRHRAVGGHTMAVHVVAEMPEGARRP
jgi:hypothetical protein